jgi:predicted DNA-binding protein YlxM (UPF0122 family)
MEESFAEATLLLDFYGWSLSDHQREILELRYHDDLAYAEIGDLFDISRQGVSDLVNRAVHSMQILEAQIHLIQTHKTLLTQSAVLSDMIQKITTEKDLSALQQQLLDQVDIIKRSLDFTDPQSVEGGSHGI